MYVSTETQSGTPFRDYLCQTFFDSRTQARACVEAPHTSPTQTSSMEEKPRRRCKRKSLQPVDDSR